MYFTKVELHNFGIYKGTHEMALTNKIDDRNITLIGGRNGRGKTTFHDAILLALYGKQALKYIQENARSYEKLLADHINKHASDDITYVSVTIVLDDETVIRVTRKWKYKNKKINQEIIVEKNGTEDKYLGENWSYYIEEILPFGIAKFFFFNNEKITQLANETSFEQIKTSIKSAIGVTVIEKAIEHAGEVIRRKKDALEAFESSELNTGYKEVGTEIEKIDKKLDEDVKELRKLELTCQKISAKLEAKENEFWAAGGELSKNRDSIKQEMEKKSKLVEQIQQDILKCASDATVPLVLCKELVTQSYNEEKSLQNDEAKRYTEEIIVDIRQKIVQKLEKAGLEPKTLASVKQIVNDELTAHTLKNGRKDRVRMAPASMVLYQNLITEVFPSLKQKIENLLKEAQSQENEYMILDAHLGVADEKTMAVQLFEALKEIEKEKALADAEYQKKTAVIESLKRQREILVKRRENLIKDMVKIENTNDDNTRIIRYAAMSIEVLTEFKLRLQREKVEKLSKTATKCFETLVEKESLVSRIDIDPDSLDVTIIDIDGKELFKNQLSAGEQQMFAVSIVWALALTSGYKAPVIIDTPMARLDSSHRVNFVTRYLPAASSQVLVLSTDEEIYGKYLDLIRDKVVSRYTLFYKEDEQCTSIIPGYFKEA